MSQKANVGLFYLTCTLLTHAGLAKQANGFPFAFSAFEQVFFIDNCSFYPANTSLLPVCYPYPCRGGSGEHPMPGTAESFATLFTLLLP
jgi:hypothetical protein